MNMKDINESDPSPSTSKAHQEVEEPLVENEPEREPVRKIEKPLNMSPGAVKLRNWLNKSLRITMSDGRVLIGIFLCTDRDANVILGSCSEYLPEKPNSDSNEAAEEPRMLGLVMVPGKHIASIFVDQNDDLVKCWNSLRQEVGVDDII